MAWVAQVEFPTLGLASCPGDSEGVNEMNESAALLRQLCTVFERAGTAEGVRVFFPGACCEEGRAAAGGGERSHLS